jgi:hypothetical protein
MPTITENGPFTILMDYEVEEGRQQEMIQGVTDLIARHIAPNPGFISASFHAVEGGRRVLNYAQWTSREAWQTATPGGPENPVTKAIVEVLTRCGGRRIAVDPIEVSRVVQNVKLLASAG